jgi:hypothetical protein
LRIPQGNAKADARRKPKTSSLLAQPGLQNRKHPARSAANRFPSLFAGKKGLGEGAAASKNLNDELDSGLSQQ